MNKTVLIIGAGCSFGSMGLSTDKNFLMIKRDNLKKQYFFDLAMRKLYQHQNLGQTGYEWSHYRLETIWSEMNANFYNPKFILHPNEVEEIYNEFKRHAKAETSTRAYYSFYYYRDTVNRTPYHYLFLFATWELKKVIQDTCGCLLRDDKRILYQKLLNFCSEEIENIGIVSFNYDTLIEQSLEDYYYEGAQERPSKKSVKIIKPHGSVNWMEIGNVKIKVQKDIIKSEEMGFENNGGRYDLYVPAIVPLIDRKPEWAEYEDVNDGEISSLHYHTYKDNMAHALMEVIRNSNSLVIVGYSFPSGDRHIRGILRDVKASMEKDKKPQLKKITMICYFENNEKDDMVDELATLFHIRKENITIYSEKWEEYINRIRKE